MAPTGKTFTTGELLTSANTNSYLDSARWAPLTTSTTSNPSTSVPRTDTWTNIGSAFSVTLPTGWTSMTVYAVCTLRFELIGGNNHTFGGRLLIAGAASSNTDSYANMIAPAPSYAHNITVARAPATVYTAAASLQLQGLVSSASTAAITVSVAVYNVIRFRES